jgi:hypothetical protein
MAARRGGNWPSQGLSHYSLETQFKINKKGAAQLHKCSKWSMQRRAAGRRDINLGSSARW